MNYRTKQISTQVFTEVGEKKIELCHCIKRTWNREVPNEITKKIIFGKLEIFFLKKEEHF